jgi:DNA-binding winged helix-turn-helix (wHTH) protein/tetratricopeptide (TPR) repeat protein
VLVSPTQETVRFGLFELNLRAAQLTRNGTKIRLPQQPLQLLSVLIESPGEIVTREQLRQRLWPSDVFIDFDHGLNKSIQKLRDALGDSADSPRYIETIPRIGYRFIARVSTAEETSTPESATPLESPPTATNPQTGFKASTKGILASALLLAIAAAGVFLSFSHHKKILAEKDTVVLADFDNSTGDPVFDGTLRQGMAVQLEQSPFLSLIPDERIQRTLRLMDQPADARLTMAVAREICERTASAAVLDGSIASLGTQYVLGLRATDCRSGKVLAEEQVQAARKEDVLNALGQIASRFRTQVGESLTTVEKYDTPLAEATTPSLEALKAYSLGGKKFGEGSLSAALSFFKRAEELDPNFAAAYGGMSIVYFNYHEPELAAENIRKAYELRAKVSERERLWIESSYYFLETGELDKEVQTLEMWQQTYPRDTGPPNALGVSYRRLGNSEKALEEDLELLRLAPDATSSYRDLAIDYVNLSRLEEADAMYKEAEARKLGYLGRAKSRYLLAFLKGDEVQMAQLASSVMGKRGEEDAMLAAQADTEAWYGRLKNARELIRRAMDSAQHNDAKETAAGYQAAAALYEVDLGDREQGRSDADAAMKLAPNRDVQEMAALALARAGDTAAAEKLADELNKTFPLDTLVQRNWLPVIRAAIALQRKDPNRAVELLQTSSEIELGENRLLPAYVRGEAYLMLHDGKHAAAEFQKYIDHRAEVRNAPWGALAHLGLARAYAMQGDTTKARAAYQDFLTIWKDADPDLPILIQAKAEYPRLQ